MNFRLSCNKDNERCLFKKFKNKRQQAIAEREQELLCLAEKLMEEHGFSGLTMDKLVAACDYSKGTVYNHFSSKEDLICALCSKCMTLELELFARAITFDGNGRERVLAVCFAYWLHAVLNPTLFYCVLIAKTPAVAERASPARLEGQLALEMQLSDTCNSLFAAAVDSGDLPKPTSLPFEAFSFAAWATAFGTNALLQAASTSQLIKGLDAQQALLFNTNLLLDGMQWTPLSSQWNYQGSWQRIGKELFADELRTLQLNKPEQA
ncbi:TetR/AcrR family transcriptional regulator [Bowmanella denitrificans]|uniref:TetR/AcrR family transcriptional regulator n=1 Tax=Bowmanella denitrificans TaxID=366582 RepID=A0ABP3HDQ0_9ALTE